MNKKNIEHLEIGVFMSFLFVIIIFAIFKDIVHNVYVTQAILALFLFLFGAIHLQKFVIYRNEKFAKRYRFLWIIFELASLLIMPQSLLLLCGVVYQKTFILEVLCLAGDFIIDIIMEKNEASNWASFLSIIKCFIKLFQKF